MAKPDPTEPSLEKAARILREIMSLWPTVADLTRRMAGHPLAAHALNRHLARVASLSAQFNEAITSLPVTATQTVLVRFPATSRGKVNVEFGDLIRYHVEVSVLEGELLAILGEAQASRPMGGPPHSPLWLPIGHLQSRLQERTGREISRHYVQQLVYRLKTTFGEFGHSHLIESKRAGGYRLLARVEVNR